MEQDANFTGELKFVGDDYSTPVPQDAPEGNPDGNAGDAIANTQEQQADGGGEAAASKWWDGMVEADDEESAKAYLKESLDYRKRYNEEYEPLKERLPKLQEIEKDVESIPLYKQFLDFMKGADVSDPAELEKKALGFIKLQATDYSGMADKDPISLLVDAKMDENPLLDRDEAMELVRSQHKVSKDDYDYDEHDEDSVKRAERLANIALKEAKHAAMQVAKRYEERKAKAVLPPSVQSRQEEQARQAQLVDQYKKVFPQHRSSLKELDYGDFKFKLEGIQPDGYEATAANGYQDFMREVAMDKEGYIDPSKIAKNAAILQHHEKIVRAAYEQGKADEVKRVTKAAANTQHPGHNSSPQNAPVVKFHN